MLEIGGTPEWHAAHAGAHIGLLEVSGLEGTGASPDLERHKRETEARLRTRYAGLDRPSLAALPVMSAYVKYYKRFEMTYHVLLQVESIAWKGRQLPAVSPLVDANFTAEVETLVLTAGHDAEKLAEPVCIDTARPGEEMTGMNGKTCLLRPGDMVMRDSQGVCCSILHGQDNRSPITVTTRHVLYVAYAPEGVPAQAVEAHLRQVEAYLRLSAPGLRVEQCRLLAAR